MKCVTPNCNDRIPSDDRAWQPCAQCGVINGSNLQKAKLIINTQSEIMSGWFHEDSGLCHEDRREAIILTYCDPVPKRLEAKKLMLQQLKESGVIHPESLLHCTAALDVIRTACRLRSNPRETWEDAKAVAQFARYVMFVRILCWRRYGLTTAYYLNHTLVELVELVMLSKGQRFYCFATKPVPF